MRTLNLDYETYCDLDIRKVGLDVYSAHPSTRVLMAAYRIDRGPLKQWFPHLDPEPPLDLIEGLTSKNFLRWAFNAQFERVITRRVLKIRTPIAGWRCTMVLSYMHCFAGGLDQVGAAMGIPADKQKLKTGNKLIKIFCGPNKVTKNQPHVRRDWDTDPELWQEFAGYNRQDVVAEEAILKRLSPYPIPDFEWELYELDQRINDRGIPVDIQFIDNVIRMSAERKKLLLARTAKLTGLKNPNSVAQLLPWLKEHGYKATDLLANTVKKSLKAGLPKLCAKVLRLRQFYSLTSTNKAKTAKQVVGAGNCIRYMLQFGGASRTLRWAGRKVQTQNMKRTPPLLDAEHDDSKLTYVTNLIREGDMAGLELAVREPMTALSGCMRSMFRCPDNEEFKTADLKSIESAVVAWLTECKRLLKVFRDGRDPYRDFGMEFYRKAYDDITREERNVCKPPALGCAYRLGPGKELENGKLTGLLGYAADMGVNMKLTDAERAVGVFRSIYHEIEEHWGLYEKAIRKVLATGKPVTVGPVTFERTPPYLTILLPSGRRIYYFRPKIERKLIFTDKWKVIRDPEHPGQTKTVRDSYVRRCFTHMGRDRIHTNKWVRREAHGGVVIEEITQAIARDVLAVSMMRAHKVGFKIVGHAHDENIARGRVGDNRLTHQYLGEIMSQAIDWAPGLPLGASGWSGAYYRK